MMSISSGSSIGQQVKKEGDPPLGVLLIAPVKEISLGVPYLIVIVLGING